MQQSFQFHQLKHWWTCQIRETAPFTAGCQSLAFSSACFGEESFRSLNPSFSRGSLVMSWLGGKARRCQQIWLVWDSLAVFPLFKNTISHWSIRHCRYSLDCSRHLELSKPLSLRHFMNLSLKAVHSPKRIDNNGHEGSTKFLPSPLCWNTTKHLQTNSISHKTIRIKAENNATWEVVSTKTHFMNFVLIKMITSYVLS